MLIQRDTRKKSFRTVPSDAETTRKNIFKREKGGSKGKDEAESIIRDANEIISFLHALQAPGQARSFVFFFEVSQERKNFSVFFDL